MPTETSTAALPKLSPTHAAVVERVLDGSVVLLKAIPTVDDADPRAVRVLARKGVLVRDLRHDVPGVASAYRLARKYRAE